MKGMQEGTTRRHKKHESSVFVFPALIRYLGLLVHGYHMKITTENQLTGRTEDNPARIAKGGSLRVRPCLRAGRKR